MSFNKFELSPEVVRGTQAMGFVEPTPIQLRAFPIVLGGKDLIGTAQTGTGKTAAFALPILTLLAKHGGLRCLVLEPTRELAAQVETAFRDYGRFTDLRVALVHGGVGYGKQREELKRGVDILVATPGRLLDLLERTNFDSALIFCRTKYGADRIAHQLKQGKHAVAVLHSNRTQRERIEALEGFKSGKYEVMVATDIASRGLDIAGVSHVINYDVPEHPEDYVHRIGRTGRAQNVGDAFTLMNGEELPALQAIERFIGQKIPRLKLENFRYLYTALFEPETSGAKRAIGGGRTHRGYSFGRRRR